MFAGATRAPCHDRGGVDLDARLPEREHSVDPALHLRLRARDGFLPAALCAVHARYRTPHVAIIVQGCLIVALALTGTYERLAIFSNLNAFVLYMLCAIAVMVLRARDVHGDGAPFRIPGGPLVPLAALLADAWLMYATAARADLSGLGIILALALLLYAVGRWRLRSASQSA